MIKRFSPNNAARFRQNSLEELNAVAAATDEDIQQIVNEVDVLETAVENAVYSVSFDNQKGTVVSIGLTNSAGEQTE